MRIAILPAPQRRSVWRLPRWLDALLSVGIVSTDLEVRRRQRFVNVAAIAGAVDSLFHVFYDASQELPGLAPLHLHNLTLTILFLTVPLTHRLGEIVAALYLTVIVLGGVCVALWLVGLESGAHIYLVIIPFVFIFLGPRHWHWFAAILAVDYVLLLAALDLAPLVGTIAPGDAAWRHSVASQVLVGALTVNALLIAYALTALRRTEQALETANAQSEALLTTLLPARIAARLKAAPAQTVAERFEQVTILFVDIVGFTAAVRNLPPEQVIDYLDRLYTRFDRLAASHGVEKIKTMGDGYMAAGGLDGDARAGAIAVGRLALAIVAAVSEQPALGGRQLAVRAGIHVGPATAGVIGERRFSYDIWGDAVNLAARLEASARPGQILASQAFAEQVAATFDFAAPGELNIRGIGNLTTRALLRPAAGTQGEAQS